MTRRALIIRSDYDPVPGAHNAAECMGQVLSARGFELTWCEGAAATRGGILAAYDALIEHARPDDAIVVYYAGHGGLATNSSYTPGALLPRHVQHICPADFADTRDDDFRGICALELSLKLAALTEKTANATVILECCFAAQMSRAMAGETGPGAAPVVRPKLTRVGLTRHLEAVRAQARAHGVVPGTVSPRAVRVAASGQTELARRVSLPRDEVLAALGIVSSRHDEWIGALTLALVQILAEIGEARVPWRAIAPALRARLLVQRPELEGPISRVPFSLDTVEHAPVAVRADGDGAIIEAGRFLGVSVGDTYRVVATGAPDEPTRVVATLTIDEVWALQARAARLVFASGHRRLPAGAIAIAEATARDPVRVVAPDPARRAVLEAVGASPRLRVATEADGDDVLGELRVSEGVLELCDRSGPLSPPAPFADRLAGAVRDLANRSTVRWLRSLPEDGGIAPAAVTLELLHAGPDGALRPMARHGEPMGLADSFAMKLENTTDTPLHASVFHIGVQHRITRISERWASGVVLPPRQPVYVDDLTCGEQRSFSLAWPGGVPRDRPRADTVMAIVTSEPADLSALDSDGDPIRRSSALFPLHQLDLPLARGVPRGSRKPAQGTILWRDYLLYPLDGSLDIGIPEIDASPPPAASRSPGRAILQVRCDAIERRRGAARIDVLVVGRSATAPVCPSTYHPGDPAAPVVWRGEVPGAIDLYVFTSTAGPDRRPLADLLRAAAVDDAIAMLRAPDGDPRVELVPGASLLIAAAARRALARADPDVATAFRGSLGPEDTGRVRYQASAVAFTLSIEATG